MPTAEYTTVLAEISSFRTLLKRSSQSDKDKASPILGKLDRKENITADELRTLLDLYYDLIGDTHTTNENYRTLAEVYRSLAKKNSPEADDQESKQDSAGDSSSDDSGDESEEGGESTSDDSAAENVLVTPLGMAITTDVCKLGANSLSLLSSRSTKFYIALGGALALWALAGLASPFSFLSKGVQAFIQPEFLCLMGGIIALHKRGYFTETRKVVKDISKAMPASELSFSRAGGKAAYSRLKEMLPLMGVIAIPRTLLTLGFEGFGAASVNTIAAVLNPVNLGVLCFSYHLYENRATLYEAVLGHAPAEGSIMKKELAAGRAWETGSPFLLLDKNSMVVWLGLLVGMGLTAGLGYATLICATGLLLMNQVDHIKKAVVPLLPEGIKKAAKSSLKNIVPNNVPQAVASTVVSSLPLGWGAFIVYHILSHVASDAISYFHGAIQAYTSGGSEYAGLAKQALSFYEFFGKIEQFDTSETNTDALQKSVKRCFSALTSKMGSGFFFKKILFFIVTYALAGFGGNGFQLAALLLFGGIQNWIATSFIGKFGSSPEGMRNAAVAYLGEARKAEVLADQTTELYVKAVPTGMLPSKKSQMKGVVTSAYAGIFKRSPGITTEKACAAATKQVNGLISAAGELITSKPKSPEALEALKILEDAGSILDKSGEALNSVTEDFLSSCRPI